jgi:hypothetical protein
MAWCEENGCDYTFGFQGNSGLDARVAYAAETMLLRHAASEDDKVRACVDVQHRPKSWTEERRFIARIEVSFQKTKSGHLTQSTDIRYCVTSLKGDPDHLFEKVYCARGQAENLISCTSPARLGPHLLPQRDRQPVPPRPAYGGLLAHARVARAPAGNERARALRVATLRLRLIKTGACVIEHAARIRVHLPTSYPERNVFARLAVVPAAPS